MAPDILGLSEEDYKILSVVADSLNMNYERGESLCEKEKMAEFEDWIVMPNFFSGLGYDMVISPKRLSHSAQIKSLENTGKDSLGRSFIGNLSRDDALNLNYSLGNRTMNLNEYVSFLCFLKQGAKGEEKIRSQRGELLRPSYLSNLKKDLCQRLIYDPNASENFPSFGEWINVDLLKDENNKNLVSGNSFLDERGQISYKSYLKQNLERYFVSVSIDQWFINKDSKGFPIYVNNPSDFIFDLSFPLEPCRSNGGIIQNGLILSKDPNYKSPFIGIRPAKILNDFPII